MSASEADDEATGLIRIENFDHFLVDAHQQMQTQDSVGTVGSGR
jgi:hypothetical protein